MTAPSCYTPQNGVLVKTLATTPDMVLTVCFSPDGARVAAGGVDNAIRIFNVTNGQQELLIEQHADWVTALAFSADGAQIVSGTWL